YATVPAGILACCRLESPARRKRVIHTKTRRKIRESLPIRGVLSGRQDAALCVRRDARRYKRRHVHRAKHAKRKSHRMANEIQSSIASPWFIGELIAGWLHYENQTCSQYPAGLLPHFAHRVRY